MKPGKTGIKRIIAATGYSFQGLTYAWKNEAAFRQECCLAIVMIPAAFFIGETAVEIILLVIPLFLIIIAELFNSAIEAVVDRIGNENHVLSGAAKDIGSATVLVCFVLLLLIWLIILVDNYSMIFS